MTFEEWWGGERDRGLAYDLMKVLAEAAKQAWHAGHATSIEEMLEKWNRTGVDIDAALHGRVNEKSPIASRLKMIAAAVGPRQPSGYAYRYGSQFGDGTTTIRFNDGGLINGGGPIETIPYWFGSAPPAPMQPQWRPIDEEADTTEDANGDVPCYLCLYAPGQEPECGSRCMVGNGMWLNAHGKQHGITHWMPLPEPPEQPND